MFVRRAINIELDTNELKSKTKKAFFALNFTAFTTPISLPHNDIHNYLRCDMSDTKTAAYDPIFWLHHSYVNRQFAFWQEVNKLRKRNIGSFEEMSKPLDPFHRQEYNKVQTTLKNSKMFLITKICFATNLTPSHLIT